MLGKNPKRQARDDAGIVPTIVGSEMMVKGDFKSDGELHVAGKVEGDIQVKTLTVGKDAVIRGAITAEQVRICGDITGCIRAREVTLTATARVLGDVHHDVLSIEAGGPPGRPRPRPGTTKGESAPPTVPPGGQTRA